MVIKPRQSGVVAICDCGSKQFIPSTSAIKTGILYCPCGHLEKVDADALNQITARSLRAHLSQRNGKTYRPPVVPKKSPLQRQIWFEEMS
jgi:hypothetical protein